jgi:seryl-tRNA synthetase
MGYDGLIVHLACGRARNTDDCNCCAPWGGGEGVDGCWLHRRRAALPQSMEHAHADLPAPTRSFALFVAPTVPQMFWASIDFFFFVSGWRSLRGSSPLLHMVLLRRLSLRPAFSRQRQSIRFISADSASKASVLKAPRLDVARIVENAAQVERNCLARNLPSLASTLPEILQVSNLRRKLLREITPLNVQRANIQKQIISTNDASIRTRLLTQALELKPKIAELEGQVNLVDDQLLSLCQNLPNFSHPDVPALPTEIGTINELTDIPHAKSHVEIAESLNILDLVVAAKATGHAWYYLKGMGVRLENALVSYAIDMAVSRGWLLVKPPDVVRTEVALACGFRPRDEHGDQIYQLAQTKMGDTGDTAQADGLCLAGTAEIPLAAMHIDAVIPEEQLPVKYVGVGTAYRAEAGSRGRETKGLYRVHQFTKVELFAWTSAGQSDGMLEDILKLQRDIVEGLGLYARVLDMPTDELGNSASRKYDIEAWMYGRGGWGEVTSASNCTDYQSRRLHTRYRSLDGRFFFAHTLNGTAVAVPRMIIAILESGLREDGRVKIPDALVKYMGVEMIDKM